MLSKSTLVAVISNVLWPVFTFFKILFFLKLLLFCYIVYYVLMALNGCSDSAVLNQSPLIA